jgi:octaprenyl-diphosphate synthase
LLSVNSREYELLEIVSEAVKEMSEGELLQIKESRKLSISERQYFEIIRKKTAALIKACSACGAKSVQASENDISKLAQFGEYLGIAFQIRDDLLDYQNTGITGKPTGNDIKQKKITLPLINALQNASLTHRKSMLSTINKGKVNVKEFIGIINFVTTMGGIEYSNKVMNEYIQKALNILDQFPDNHARQSLKSLVEYTAQRKQ